MSKDNKISSVDTPSPCVSVNRKVQKTRVIAFTSGKGGVGKTSLSVNLALTLARSGSNVCLFDADMGMANVNIMLGITPEYTLEHVFTGEKNIQDIVVNGPMGLDIVPGASGFAKCVDLEGDQQQRLVSALQDLEPRYDYLIIDTSAGISSTVLHFVAAAQTAAIVITPEPTSLTDAFSLLKVLRRRGYKRTPQVVVNMAQNTTAAEKIYRRFDAAVKKYVGLNTAYLGSVWMDESIRAAVTLQRPVAMFPETDPSYKRFMRLADNVEYLYRQGGVPNVSFSTYWEKVVERAAKRKADAAAMSKEKTNEKPTECKSSGHEPKHKTEGHSATDQPQPLQQTSEDQWVDLRIRLNQFLKNQDTTPEQVTTLLSNCIYSYGEQLGSVAIDLLHGLLQMINPATLSEEHRRLMIQSLERLQHTSAETTKSESEGETESSVGEHSVLAAGAEAPKQKHQYDETGFGSQDRLIEKIRASKGQVSLDHLLESIKYASLVES